MPNVGGEKKVGASGQPLDDRKVLRAGYVMRQSPDMARKLRVEFDGAISI